MRDYVLSLIPQLSKKPIDFQNAIIRKYENFIKNSQIPNVCYQFNDTSIIPTKLKKLYNNIITAFKDRYNFMLNFESYDNISYLIQLFLDKYFVDCINEDSLVENILYIDAKLLVEDYKRLMNYEGDTTGLEPVHHLDVLYKDIEAAPIVIWDKLMLINSNYDKDKLLDIITIRNRRGLGNIYITIENAAKLGAILGANLCLEMKSTLDLALDCATSKIQIPRSKEVSMFK